MHPVINVFLFHSARKDIINQPWSSATESGIDGDDEEIGMLMKKSEVALGSRS